MKQKTFYVATTHVQVASLKCERNEKANATLVEDVKKRGVMVPIVVRNENVLSGEKRVDAARRCGIKTVPAISIPFFPAKTIQKIVALIEKLLTAEMSSHDLAKHIVELRNGEGVTPAGLADILGKSRGFFCNLARWWEHAPREVKEAWRKKSAIVSYARLEYLCRLPKSEVGGAWHKMQDRTFEVTTEKPKTRPSVKDLRKLTSAIEDLKVKDGPKKLISDVCKYASGDLDSITWLENPEKLEKILAA